jgi:hypothetical protein
MESPRGGLRAANLSSSRRLEATAHLLSRIRSSSSTAWTWRAATTCASVTAEVAPAEATSRAPFQTSNHRARSEQAIGRELRNLERVGVAVSREVIQAEDASRLVEAMEAIKTRPRANAGMRVFGRQFRQPIDEPRVVPNLEAVELVPVPLENGTSLLDEGAVRPAGENFDGSDVAATEQVAAHANLPADRTRAGRRVHDRWRWNAPLTRQRPSGSRADSGNFGKNVSRQADAAA